MRGLDVRVFGCVYPGICGMGELLLDTGLDEEQDEYAHFIHANAKSMLHIVNDVLDFSRVESNKVRRGGLMCVHCSSRHDSVVRWRVRLSWRLCPLMCAAWPRA